MASVQGCTEVWDAHGSHFSACVRRKELKQTWWKERRRDSMGGQEEEMSERGGGSERRVRGSEEGGSLVSTSWVMEPDLSHLDTITQISTTS